jgi:hypothetical protein
MTTFFAAYHYPQALRKKAKTTEPRRLERKKEISTEDD